MTTDWILFFILCSSLHQLCIHWVQSEAMGSINRLYVACDITMLEEQAAAAAAHRSRD